MHKSRINETGESPSDAAIAKRKIEKKYVVSTKVGEYLGLVDTHIVKMWNELPPGRPVLVTRYNSLFGKQGTEIKFVKSALNHPEIVTSREYESLFNLNSYKEDDMSLSKDLVKIAAEKGLEALEAVLQERMKIIIKRAAKYAEEHCEFVAIPVITAIQVKYGTPVKSGDILDAKETKKVKLAKFGDINEAVWIAIMGKAAKIGVIMSNQNGKATLRIKNDEYTTFVKAAKLVKGLSVTAEVPAKVPAK